jgi:hypothetical protein
MLASDADLRMNARFCSKGFDQRRHLDGFWAGTEDRKDFNPWMMTSDERPSSRSFSAQHKSRPKLLFNLSELVLLDFS